MAQKIDIFGLFIDPETIEDLLLQKRISIYYPVFYEVAVPKSIFGRSKVNEHILQFHHQEPYGIILADEEQPDPSGYIVDYKTAVIERLLRGLGRAGKTVSGHIAESLKIEVSGDRQYRILQSGRNVKRTSIREIPAKVHLSSGQWVDVFKSSPDYDFQGGTPYAITDVGASALMIATKDKTYVLYGAGVDASNEEVISTYQSLTELYNKIQAERDAVLEAKQKKQIKQRPQINIQFPKAKLPQLKLQSPFVIEKKDETDLALKTDSEKDNLIKKEIDE